MDGLENTEKLSPSGLEIDAQAKAFLNETAKWAKFFAIVGFVMVGFFVLFGFLILGSSSMYSSLLPNMGNSDSLFGVGLGIFYILLIILYLYPLWKLYEFANFSKKALKSDDSHLLTKAFRAQKSLYQFMGILLILLLCFYASMFLFTIGSFAF